MSPVSQQRGKMTRAIAQGDRWAGGKEGEAFPVEMGQTWRVGNHVYLANDLMATRLFDALLDRVDDPPTLVYCDPPWGQGLVNSFRTKAGLPHASYRWEQLYRRIADLGHDRGLPVWLEGSVIESRDGQVIPRTMALPARRGTPHAAYWQIEYANHQPAGLYYAGFAPPPPQLENVLTGMHDRHTPRAVMETYPRGVVIEPCCGLGGTPLNAEKVGWGSVNSEINTFRMSAALFRMAKATGLTPERVE